jgi:capsular polysaccharide biosynthesis protein
LEINFCDVEQWLALADRRIACNLAPYQVKDAAGHVIKITPFITECRGLTVLGGDWIPIREDGAALLEQMVHTPILYPGKARNIREEAGKCIAEIKAVNEYPGSVVVIGGSANYYHWLIDSLPRLLLAKQHVDISTYKIVVNKPLQRFQRESLALLGIEDQQLLQVGDDEAIRARSTLVPSLLASTTVPHPMLPKMLQNAFPERHRSPHRRVYLSRQEASSRRLLNEAELIPLLKRYGFQRIVPSTLSFQEQIDLCYGADALVAVHGAGMANIAFCPASTKVFEIFSPHHKVTSMYMLSRTCKREHRFIPAQNISFGKDGNALLGDWEVDLNAMESALRSAFELDQSVDRSVE